MDEVTRNEETGENQDERLSIAFDRVFLGELDPEEKEPLTDIMNAFMCLHLGKDFDSLPIKFDNSLDDTDHVIAFATQIAALKMWPLTEEEIETIPHAKENGCKWGAVIKDTNEAANLVHGRTVRLTIILAILQVWRDYTRALLNPPTGQSRH